MTLDVRALIDADFDARLDEYQATLAEEAHEAQLRSYEAARRPDAVPAEVTFGDLRPGDYMTNEGPAGRWVRVVEVRGPACYVRSRTRTCPIDAVSVLFELVESVVVSGETRYWIERCRNEAVLIDLAARA